MRGVPAWAAASSLQSEPRSSTFQEGCACVFACACRVAAPGRGREAADHLHNDRLAAAFCPQADVGLTGSFMVAYTRIAAAVGFLCALRAAFIMEGGGVKTPSSLPPPIDGIPSCAWICTFNRILINKFQMNEQMHFF